VNRDSSPRILLRTTGDTDITIDPPWTNEFTPIGDGKAVEFRDVGTGDTGGAPTEETAFVPIASACSADHVRYASSARMLPTTEGE
jgi:hypothetical protein